MFLIIFLSDMHLSDFLINVIFRASRNDKKFSNKYTLFTKFVDFNGNMWQIFLLLWQNFHIFVAKFGKIWDFKW